MLWRETVKEPTQLEVARQELFAATRHRDRMLTNFNNALPEFFEIANQELTIAQMTVDVCMKKVKLLTAQPICAISSAGRAYALQAWGRRFEPVIAHHHQQKRSEPYESCIGRHQILYDW